MDQQAKNNIIKQILECTKSAFEIDSDDSDKDEFIIGLVDLCSKASTLPVERQKRQWVKPWRNEKNKHGSFAFLTKELKINDISSFCNFLRMDETHFNYLLSLIKFDIELCDTKLRDAIPPAEQLAVTLRFLATGESFQSLNYQTRLSTSSISRIVPRVCTSIWRRLKSDHVKFPSSYSEWLGVAKEFGTRWQFPNCIGALDGKHINFRSPRKDGAFYHNYKGTNSILLMGLVDANCKFLFVDIGCNGRANDAGVFMQSELSAILEESRGLPQDSIVGKGRILPYVVVADDAFPLHKHIMKPYPFHTTCEKKRTFNRRISRARHVVEHAFGILSNRFRVFLTTMHLKVETVEQVSLACCALHNYMLDNDINYLSSTQNASSDSHFSTSISANNPRKGQAEKTRQEFSNYFNEEGKLELVKKN